MVCLSRRRPSKVVKYTFDVIIWKINRPFRVFMFPKPKGSGGDWIHTADTLKRPREMGVVALHTAGIVLSVLA